MTELPQRVLPHTPARPLWMCRACGLPWPCPSARLLLKCEYDSDPVGLSVYLCGLLHLAIADLYRLNPHDAPAPGVLFNRFVGWSPRCRRPA